MIITITLNPAVDKTVQIDNFSAGAVNRVKAMRLDAGGKGINVSKVIKSLDGSSQAIGILGGKAGAFIKDYLDSVQIKNNFVFVEGETRTNLKIVDSINHSNTDINETGPSIGDKDIDEVMKVMMDNLNKDSIAVFSGSVPVGVSKEIYKNMISAAKEKGAKTILDADGDLFKYGIEAGPYLVKPNIHELERFYGIEIKSTEEAIKLAKSMKEQYKIEMVVVSLGEKGALFINNESTVIANGIKVKVISTVGAGDSMVAALAHTIDKGCSFEDSIKLAVAAGTANVMTSGTQAAELSVINEIVKQVTFRYV